MAAVLAARAVAGCSGGGGRFFPLQPFQSLRSLLKHFLEGSLVLDGFFLLRLSLLGRTIPLGHNHLQLGLLQRIDARFSVPSDLMVEISVVL